MITVRGLQAAAAVTAVVLAGTCWQLGSATSRNRPADGLAKNITTPQDARPSAELSGLFGNRPLITYKTVSGESYFALQLKPTIADAPAQPRDLVFVLDISASQAGLPLLNARTLTEAVIKLTGPTDRVSIWTVNTPEETKCLTGGLNEPANARVSEALKQLERVIYAAGATDLKGGMKKILSGLPSNNARRTTLVYLGDGESVLDPLTNADRNRIAADLVDRQIAFVPVPLGNKINAKTIHGLSSATGGIVVRFGTSDNVTDVASRLIKATDAPVLYPTKAEFNDVVSDVLPTKMPPLRSDAPTLVAGQLKAAGTMTCKLEGTVGGRPTSVAIQEAVPTSDATNYFLMTMVRQWRDSDRAAPAMMRADRGLGLAYEQTRLAKDEFVAQGNWALGLNKLDVATNLFQAARAIDPADAESASALKVVERLKTGEVTRDQMLKEVKASSTEQAEVVRANVAQQVPPPPTGSEPAAGPGLLDLERRRRAVQEQQVGQLVDDAIRQARTLVQSDPDAAYDLLKRQFGSVTDNGDLSPAVRAGLGNRLESALRTVQAEGAAVKLKQEAQLRARIAAEARRGAEAARLSEEERTRQRVKIISELMDRARYEESYKESLDLQRDLTAKGRVIPPAVSASYVVGTNAAALRDYEEIRRLKEDRFLLTMLLVDKSHIPMPDEPPVAFPPAAYWKEISDYRKDRYEFEALGGRSRKAVEIRDRLSRPVSIDKDFSGGIPLSIFLDELSTRYDITFILNQGAFREQAGEGRKMEEETVRIPKMPGVSLATLLSYALSTLTPPSTYLIRRDYVEITTKKAAGYEKTVRAYPVADLVIPIPNAVDQLSLQQNLQVLGGSLSANGQAIFGSAGGGLNFGFQGGAGQLGGLQFGGGFGAGGGGGGGGGGIVGGLFGNQGGVQGGALGFAGGSNTVNQGFGGGVLGFGGGQQGQFGNLGGQFGIQGGDTSVFLIDLIHKTIAPREWNNLDSRLLNQAALVREEGEDTPPDPPHLLNALSYYQPARALVVRGSARMHNRVGDFTSPTAQPGAAAPRDRGGDVIVFNRGSERVNGANAVAQAPKPVEATKKNDDPKALVKKTDYDPKGIWHDHMAQGHFKPRQVIAMADMLNLCDKFEDVAELLKADLRFGVLGHSCEFDALATALQASGASVEEVTRAKLSKIDLEPNNPQSFIDVAAAMADLGRFDKAVEFCQRASALEPSSSEPYHRALVLAGDVQNPSTDAVAWAASNLLQRDWGVDSPIYHQQAKSSLEHLAARFQNQGRAADADKLREVAARHQVRDLVIEMTYGDQADLDLFVTEPAGTVCSVKSPRTPAGGLWTGDRLGANQESYVAAQAFSGTYQIAVRKIWGQPLGNKATIKVTKHQGSDKESVELHTVRLDAAGKGAVQFQLDDGRRTETESVPVASTLKHAPVAKGQTPDEVTALLRSMADPMLAVAKPGMKSSNTDVSPYGKTTFESGVELSHQTKVSPALSSGVELLTETTISPDRSTMTVKLSPAFNVNTGVHPKIPLAVVPGGQ